MSAKQAEIVTAFGFDLPYLPDETYPPPLPSEIFPKRAAPIVVADGGVRSLTTMTWGFPTYIPSKRDPAVKLEKAVTNVRNYGSPFWRSALANPERRCLVPFTSFSEYGPGPKGGMPLYWFDIPSRPLAAFAGVWRPSDSGPLFAFLTCEPNSVVASIHPRAMPVILFEDDYDRWLQAPMDDALMLAAPFPSQLMSVSGPTLP